MTFETHLVYLLVEIAQSVQRQTMYWTAGVRFSAGKRDFSLPQRPDRL
jgi:hypothetical protein